MIKIGICDDSHHSCFELEEMIRNYTMSKGIKTEFKIWFSGESLCDDIKNNENLDCLFLDIDLGTSNGINVGKFIRDEIENYLIDIIFISYRKDYAYQLFEIGPIGFLIKPMNQKNVNEVMHTFIKKLNSHNKFFEFEYDRTAYRIQYNEIIYFKSDNKKIHIVTNKKVYCYYDKLEKVADKVKDNFILIHKSYLINPKYIIQNSFDCVKMINNDVLSISKAHRKAMRQIIFQWREIVDSGNIEIDIK